MTDQFRNLKRLMFLVENAPGLPSTVADGVLIARRLLLSVQRVGQALMPPRAPAGENGEDKVLRECRETVIDGFGETLLSLLPMPPPPTHDAELDLSRFLGLEHGMPIAAALNHVESNEAQIVERLEWLSRSLVKVIRRRISDLSLIQSDVLLEEASFLVDKSEVSRPRIPIPFTPLGAVSFEDVRAAQTSSGKPVVAAPATVPTATDETVTLRQRIADLEDQAGRAKHDRSEAMAKVERRDAAIRRYEADLASLRRQLLALQPHTPSSGVTPDAESIVQFPTSWADLEDFAARNLAPSVILTSKAIHAARASQFEDVAFAYEVLLMLANDYVPMRRGDPAARARFEGAQQRLRVEVSKTGTAVDQQRRRPTYSVHFDGRRYPLDWHVRGNSSRDPRIGFRLYFHYRESDEGLLLVGSFPGHLDSDAS